MSGFIFSQCIYMCIYIYDLIHLNHYLKSNYVSSSPVLGLVLGPVLDLDLYLLEKSMNP